MLSVLHIDMGPGSVCVMFSFSLYKDSLAVAAVQRGIHSATRVLGKPSKGCGFYSWFRISKELGIAYLLIKFTWGQNRCGTRFISASVRHSNNAWALSHNKPSKAATAVKCSSSNDWAIPAVLQPQPREQTVLQVVRGHICTEDRQPSSLHATEWINPESNQSALSSCCSQNTPHSSASHSVSAPTGWH